jgi:hypothetical protein
VTNINDTTVGFGYIKFHFSNVPDIIIYQVTAQLPINVSPEYSIIGELSLWAQLVGSGITVRNFLVKNYFPRATAITSGAATFTADLKSPVYIPSGSLSLIVFGDVFIVPQPVSLTAVINYEVLE